MRFHNISNQRLATFVLVFCTLFASACSSNDSSGENSAATNSEDSCPMREAITGRPVIIATTVAPITSIAANIAAGTPTIIQGIVPEGTNSHTYEPPPSVAATLEDADIVFINGLVLEEPTKELARANARSGSVICELATTILPEDEWIYDFSFPKEGGKPNPHLWTDPQMAGDYAALIRDSLTAADPTHAAQYAENYAAFALKIDAIDQAVAQATATMSEDQRQLLTYHDAYAYFARTYGWTVIGAIQPSSFEEPTPKEIADLMDQVKLSGVKAIFGSEVFPSTVLEQIGKETGVRYVDVLRDDDLIGGPGDSDHSWMGLMRFNYVTMVEALGGDASALKSLDTSDVGPDTANYPQ
jgi:ABC-type Zn uptake system ZnuABC Zn-binding protein ZnuA